MEKGSDWRGKSIVLTELNQGKELATQLKNQLDPTSPLSPETCELLLGKILSSYDKALSLLNFNLSIPDSAVPTSYSPNPVGSPLKKRKAMPPRLSKLVRVCSERGLEGSHGDGHVWRKYGQKDILGAKFPRAYYRCSHRHARGCSAKKQVQRSDVDPSLVEVTYKGRHSCVQTQIQQFPNSTQELDFLEKEDPKQTIKQEEEEEEEEEENQNPVSNLEMGLRDEIFPCLPFLSTQLEYEFLENSNRFSMEESNFLGNSSSPFVSPSTSASNYFNFELDNSLQSPGSDFTEIISATNSIPNSPTSDLMDLLLDGVDFNSSFPLDNPDFFSWPPLNQQ